MNKIGVTGANGYIGKALVKAGVLPISSDVTNPDGLRHEIGNMKPDIILHLAAKSDPDWCQKKENAETLANVNLRGTNNVFTQAENFGIPCVLMSTGQIWSGGFWEKEHRENDEFTPPVNQYGLSKLEAEIIVKELFPSGKIIRSSFVFDIERLSSKLGSLRAGVTLKEPTFIRRSFIYLDDYVRLLLEYCERIDEMPSILHLAGKDTVSWYDFTWELACQYGYDTDLVKARRSDSGGFAPRPSNAGLDTTLARSLGFRIPGYIDGIKRMRSEAQTTPL